MTRRWHNFDGLTSAAIAIGMLLLAVIVGAMVGW